MTFIAGWFDGKEELLKPQRPSVPSIYVILSCGQADVCMLTCEGGSYAP